MDWNAILQMVLQAVIAVAVPFLVKLLFDWLNLQKSKLIEQIDEKTRWLIEEAVRIAVQAAEQSGMAGLLKEQYESKKAYALDVAEKYLAQFGVVIDLDVLADMIESAVWEYFNNKPAPAD